jgi:molybdate transport system substrate-binding protein
VVRLLGFTLLLLSYAVSGATLKIAVAANFKSLLKQLAPQFEQQQSLRLSLSSASTGVLYAQIRHGAPFDVFLAADEKRPELLIAEQQVADNKRYTYAVGQLVLWHKTATLNKPDRGLLSRWNKKIALANAKTAPYGMAAKSVLKQLGLWQAQQPRLVIGSNIAQTQQFIESGNVDLGFVGLSQVIARAQSETGQYWLLPAAWYPKLNQQVVILKRSKRPLAAKAFVNWLMSAKIQQHIIAAGYLSVTAEQQ